MRKLPVLLSMILLPAAASADASLFKTTGGQTALSMKIVRQTRQGLVVRLQDPTQLAFNGRRKSVTATLRPDGSGARGWTSYVGTSRSDWGIQLSLQDGALAGQRGKLAGLGLSAPDPFSHGDTDHAVFWHMQLKN